MILYMIELIYVYLQLIFVRKMRLLLADEPQICTDLFVLNLFIN